PLASGPKVVQLLRNGQQRSQMRLKCSYGTNEEQPPRFVNFASRQRTRGIARHDSPLGRYGLSRVLPDPRWTAAVQRRADRAVPGDAPAAADRTPAPRAARQLKSGRGRAPAPCVKPAR